jgi:hypothetical protein
MVWIWGVYKYRRYVDELPPAESIGDTAYVPLIPPYGGKPASSEWWNAVQRYYYRVYPYPGPT